MKFACKIFFFLLSFTVLLAHPLKIELKSPAAILMNADTGAILYEKKGEERRFPASLTKIATALYVLEKKHHLLQEKVRASKEALRLITPEERQKNLSPPYRLDTSGSRIGLQVGEVCSYETLLYGLLLASGNDSANVLAEAISGTIPQFMKELNQFLKSKKIDNTQFVNPHGFHHQDHWTTPYDIAQMARLAMDFSFFKKVVKTRQYLKPQEEGKPDHYFIQTNKLLKPGVHCYSKATGMKTGYTAQAGYSLAVSATHEGRTLIAVLMGCQESQDRFSDAIKLLEQAFSEKKITRTLFSKGTDQFSCSLEGASQELKAQLNDDVKVCYYPAEEPSFQAEIVWEKRSLPIYKNEQVGVIRCIDAKGHILAQEPLCAIDSLSKTWIKQLKDGVGQYQRLIVIFILINTVMIGLIYFGKKNQKIR